MINLMTLFEGAAKAINEEDYEEALRKFMTLYESSGADSAVSQMVRRKYGFFGWANLTTMYPPARKAFNEALADCRRRATDAGDQVARADVRAMEQAIKSVEPYKDEGS